MANKNYFDAVNECLDLLTDEQVYALLLDAGLENCPYEDEYIDMETFFESGNLELPLFGSLYLKDSYDCSTLLNYIQVA